MVIIFVMFLIAFLELCLIVKSDRLELMNALMIYRMLMTGMDHYGIDNQRHHDGFTDLAVSSEYLDRDDFLDTSYFVDQRIHPMMGAGKAGSTSGKRKGVDLIREEEDDEEPKTVGVIDPDENDEINIGGDEEVDIGGEDVLAGPSSGAVDLEVAQDCEEAPDAS